MNSERRVLVKYGGAAIAATDDRARLMKDLALLHGGGHRLLVVHGGGPQLTDVAKRLGIAPVFRGGRRVTDAAMLEVVQMVLAGSVGTAMLASALAEGLPAIATSASSGGFIRAVKRPKRAVAGHDEAVDFGRVADVAQVRPEVVENLWIAGLLPVFCSLVATDDGQLLNLNADSLSRAIALHLNLTDLVYVADVPGVFGDLNDPSTHISDLTPAKIAALIADGSVTGGMIAKLDEIATIVDAVGLSAWIVGRDQPNPVSSALLGGPGLRTRVSPSR